MCHALTVLAKVAETEQDQVLARSLYQESLDVVIEVGDKVLIALGLEGLLTVAIFADLLYTFLIFWTRRRKGQWQRQNKSKSCFD